MKKLILLITLLFVCQIAISQNKDAYVIYNAKGKKVSYKKMLKKLKNKEIVFFGETHNNAISHWLEYEVTSDMFKTNKLILGAEMFEADNQTPLNDYLNEKIDDKGLDTLARLWKNYKTDYAPLVNFAKDNKLQFVATNIPRRFANLVYQKGFKALDTLSTQEKKWIAPLPITFDSELPTYKNILKMMGDHGTPELVMAQATKDATMAYFISENFKPNHTFIHYNGSYHSDYYEGILWYMKKANSTINFATITTASQDNIYKLDEENKGRADFIICVDSNMTNTY